MLRAAHPHARILKIDTSRAAALPGVAAVLTARDIPGSPVFGVVTANQQILASDRVHYLGDGVALVAAVSREVAEAALALIEVGYQPLPAVTDPEAAMKPESPKVHGDDNVFVHHKVEASEDLERRRARVRQP